MITCNIVWTLNNISILWFYWWRLNRIINSFVGCWCYFGQSNVHSLWSSAHCWPVWTCWLTATGMCLLLSKLYSTIVECSCFNFTMYVCRHWSTTRICTTSSVPWYRLTYSMLRYRTVSAVCNWLLCHQSLHVPVSQWLTCLTVRKLVSLARGLLYALTWRGFFDHSLCNLSLLLKLALSHLIMALQSNAICFNAVWHGQLWFGQFALLHWFNGVYAN